MCLQQQRGIKTYSPFLHARRAIIIFADTCCYCIDVKVIFLRRYIYVQEKEETLEKGTQMVSLNGI